LLASALGTVFELSEAVDLYRKSYGDSVTDNVYIADTLFGRCRLPVARRRGEEYQFQTVAVKSIQIFTNYSGGDH
jgi:ATP phosphoribosyltransferase